jgi:hypothetical protein
MDWPESTKKKLLDFNSSLKQMLQKATLSLGNVIKFAYHIPWSV